MYCALRTHAVKRPTYMPVGLRTPSLDKVSRCWTVTLYEHARGTGRELFLKADNADLGHDSFNDIESNVLVERDPNSGDKCSQSSAIPPLPSFWPVSYTHLTLPTSDLV